MRPDNNNQYPNTTLIESSTVTFTPLPSFDLTYKMLAKVYRQEGDLKYEYNPFRNIFSEGEVENVNNVDVISDVGKLKDFRTKQLGFNLNNPIDMTIQPSYDGTVNVILNDDINPPRLINSRFTPKEDLRYEIVDRIGNNDTNVYKEEFLDQTTRLFKVTEKIPYVIYNGIEDGGNLEVGNYVFYFKYVDADGNESDIIAESGIVSCHMGKINDPFSIKGGMYKENSNKLVKLTLSNIDTSYDYVNIYFSKNTGDETKHTITEYYKLSSKKSIQGQSSLDMTITGFDKVEQISIDQLNIQYNIVDKVKTQAQIQNMLFLANVDKPTVPYKELTDLSLRFYPSISTDENIGRLTHNYDPIPLQSNLDDYEYYNTHNIYKHTGYWNKEMYRVGVVYILKDDSLSPVFNTRGVNNLGKMDNVGDFASKVSKYYTHTALRDLNGNRQYIESNEGFILDSSKDLENSKGVIRIEHNDPLIKDNGIFPIAIDFNVEDETIAEIKKFAKGFFFVRQKRIPTTLMQAVTIGTDNVSYVPTLIANARGSDGNPKVGYITESFMNNNNELTHDFPSRLRFSPAATVSGLIAPEAILNSEMYNNHFTGSNFNLSESSSTPDNGYFEQDLTNERHFFIDKYKNGVSNTIEHDVKLTLIEDDKPLRYSGTKRFSTRVGIPEEAWRVGYYGREDQSARADYLIRGSYTGFVGMEGYRNPTAIVDIHLPGYTFRNMREYFKIRFDTEDSFHAISDRYDLNLLLRKRNVYREYEKSDNQNFSRFKIYRGDCFINTVTVRIQRNFQDPEVPISDTIVDPFTWRDNYKGFTQAGSMNNDDLNKINRNDVNAVQIGHWATFKICSNINLAFRSINASNGAEHALTGTHRTFYPLSSMSTKGESKIPESTLFNAGYNTSVSDKIYYPVPDVPYIKNIFDTRIMFSETHVTDAFRNGYRIFQGLSYKDVTRQFGGIVKIFNVADNLLTVFERGIGLFGINREALIASPETGNIHLTGIGVLPEKPQIISDKYGSMWQDSIIRTDHWIYGIDTIAKKVWRTNGRNFETISDFKIQKFLNDNITLSEDDKKPMIGLKNVKSHYNAFKGDVIFTFYDTTRDDVEHQWSICFNELDNKWITRYSWIPLASESINNIWFSFDRDSGKKIALPGYTNNRNVESVGITLFGKQESFTRGNIRRTEEDQINIVQTSAHRIANIVMKGYDYYDKYILKYKIPTTSKFPDNEYFEIRNDYELWWKGASSFPKYGFELQLVVELYSVFGGVETKVQEFNDILGVKVARNYIWSLNDVVLLNEYDDEFSTWFWKHGQAGIFDNAEDITPTKWYGIQHPFEYEFVVVDSPATHKIFNNLKIVSNNAEPDSFDFTVTKDVYKTDNLTSDITVNHNSTQITTVLEDVVTTYQKGLDISTEGRMRGNMNYSEDFWNVEIKPNRFTVGDKIKEGRVRDKYCIMRVKYTGENLALITALMTLYTISYA